MPRIALGVLLLAAVACAPATTFVPFQAVRSKVAGPPTVRGGIAVSAIEVYEGDIQYLSAAGAILVGHVTGRVEHEGTCRAALNGGTHVIKERIMLGGTETSTLMGPTYDLMGQPTGNYAAYSQTHDRSTEVYAVFRVERDRWPDLPKVIRPRDSRTFPKAVWNGDPELWGACR